MLTSSEIRLSLTTSTRQAVAEAEVAALLNIHETVAALADEKRALLSALEAQRVRTVAE